MPLLDALMHMYGPVHACTCMVLCNQLNLHKTIYVAHGPTNLCQSHKVHDHDYHLFNVMHILAISPDQVSIALAALRLARPHS